MRFCRRVGILVGLWLTTAGASAQPLADRVGAALQAPQTRQAVRDGYAADRFEDAAALAEKYLSANPADGELWFTLGSAQLRLGRTDSAVAALQKAHALGWRPDDCLYDIACALATGGRPEEALDALQRAFDAGYVAQPDHLRRDADLASIRAHPRFDLITGLEGPPGLSRDDKWRHDIDFFRRRVEAVHYSPFRVMSRAEFEQALSDLKRDVPTLSNIDVQLRLQLILAAIGDGHTRLQLPEMRLQSLPVRFYDFADGLFVRAATTEQRDLAGCRVLGIGRVSAAEALQAVRPLVSRDNEQRVRRLAAELLSWYEVLRFFDVTEEAGTVPLRLATPSGEERRVELPLIAARAATWVEARELDGGEPPLYLRHRAEVLHFEFLPDDRIAYLRLWNIIDGRDETMEDFAARAFDFIESNDVAAAVIDLRQNGGGNNYLNRFLMQRLLRCDKLLTPGRLFVLADRFTFSAAMGLLAGLDSQTEALVVGEPAGTRPNSVGETTWITLPCTRTTFSCGSRYHQYSHSNDFRTTIAPDLPAELTSQDFRDNRDPSLEVVRAYLRKNVPATTTAPAGGQR